MYFSSDRKVFLVNFMKFQNFKIVTLCIAFAGFHATVFAYGATGAGKTFTMVGTPEHPGCMAKALNELFETMERTATEFVFKGFYVQSSLQSKQDRK